MMIHGVEGGLPAGSARHGHGITPFHRTQHGADGPISAIHDEALPVAPLILNAHSHLPGIGWRAPKPISANGAHTESRRSRDGTCSPNDQEHKGDPQDQKGVKGASPWRMGSQWANSMVASQGSASSCWG